MSDASPAEAPAPSPSRLPLLARLSFGVGPVAEGAQNVAFGTFVLFFVLAFGILGFAAKAVIQWILKI